MTLELNKVAEQIDEMGKVLAGRAGRQRKVLPAARELLRLFANRQEELRQVAESEPGQRLRCARPSDESLDAALLAEAMPKRVTLVAADGSQIYPDRHGLVLYYVINVGTIVFRHGSGLAPDVATDPQVFYREDQVFPGGQPATGDLIGARRNLAEMQALADLTLTEPAAGPPRLALGDGPLLVWLQRADLPKGWQERILAGYLGCLDRLRAGQAPVAGFVSRPRSAEVMTLLYLAQLAPEERYGVDSLHETNYRGLSDRALFGFLAPGERSALFVRGTAANQDFRARGHEIYFFYLHTGAELARVEVPEWVAGQPERLNLVHATVYDQCRFNNGYPYVLTRADEQAVIQGQEREALEEMLVRAMTRHGLPLPELSRKAQQKQVARWRQR
ncbi:MAG: DNA double-strand break repair nuclease NurA [Anaerolineae bacterium]|jgi:hypothetical protein